MATPYMNLTLPTVGGSSNAWGGLLNTALTAIDDHDHTTGNGTKVPTAGININADLELNSYNLKETRALRFDNQGSLLVGGGTEIRELFVYAGDLYYINNDGDVVQITDGDQIDASSIGGITGLSGTTGAMTYSDVLKTFIATQNTNHPAKLDTGDHRIREAVSAGKGPLLKAATGTAADFDLTFPSALPASTKFLSVSSAGAISHANTIQATDIASDAVITAKILDSNVTTAKIADGNVTFAKVAAGIQVGYARVADGAYATGSGAGIPIDDTIPQSTEGYQFMTLSYTPKKIGNKLVIKAFGVFGVATGVANNGIVGAVFKDSGANAIGAVTSEVGADVYSNTVLVQCEETIASISAATWKFRAGLNTGDAIYFNGVRSAGPGRNLGGVSASWMEIVEIAQ